MKEASGQQRRLEKYKSELLTVSEVADVLGVSENQARYLAREGKITKAKRGKYERVSVEKYIDYLRQGETVIVPKNYPFRWFVYGHSVKNGVRIPAKGDITFLGKQRGKLFKTRLLDFAYLIQRIQRDCARGFVRKYYELGGVCAEYDDHERDSEGINRCFLFDLVRQKREQMTKAREQIGIKRQYNKKKTDATK